MSDSVTLLNELGSEIVGCRRCSRLVAWREAAPLHPPPSLQGSRYWAKPVPGFGDPAARIYALGLAPSAHGGNRTGRSFTGNPTADWLVAALYRAGLANQTTSEHRGDGLVLRGVWMGSAVRCAPPQNRPTALEKAACLPFLHAELSALRELRVVLALGQFAWRCAVESLADRPFATFGHGAQQTTRSGLRILGSYHPSPQNTNTGVLTTAMLAEVIERAKQLAADDPGT